VNSPAWSKNNDEAVRPLFLYFSFFGGFAGLGYSFFFDRSFSGL